MFQMNSSLAMKKTIWLEEGAISFFRRLVTGSCNVMHLSTHKTGPPTRAWDSSKL